jgi:RNA polymerase sigma-70 factor (ECF subfamily)
VDVSGDGADKGERQGERQGERVRATAARGEEWRVADRDSLLVVRAAEGDESAFETLVRRHGPVLLGLAHRLLGNRADAEDAVQESLVSAWRRLPEFRRQAAFRSWMYRIVTNRCLSVLRARRPATPLRSSTGSPGSR